jgi:hypothetical protein
LTSVKGFIATHQGVSILTFAGTDTASLADWIVDFSIHPDVDAVHASFEAGVNAAWKTISAVLGAGGTSATGRLLITGASLMLASVCGSAWGPGADRRHNSLVSLP